MAHQENHPLTIAIRKTDCTIEDIRSVLKRHPNVLDEINVFSETNPLTTAIENKKDKGIIEELLKHGIGIHLMHLEQLALRKVMETDSELQCKLVKLLVDYFTKIKINSWDEEDALLCVFILQEHYKKESSAPILRMMLQHANQFNKDIGFRCMYETALVLLCRCRNGHDFETTKAIEAAKVFLEAGVHPGLPLFTQLFRNTMKLNSISEPAVSCMKRLFHLLMQYVIMGNFPEDEAVVNYDVAKDHEHSLEQLHLQNNKILFMAVRNLWNKCIEECRKMQCDILKNDCSVLQALQSLCEMKPQVNNMTVAILHDIMLKIAQNKYTFFKDVAYHALKNSCYINDLYAYIWHMSENQGGVFLNPNCFDALSQYLSEEDSINYLLALLPTEKAQLNTGFSKLKIDLGSSQGGVDVGEAMSVVHPGK